jgi:hypothetical protein
MSQKPEGGGIREEAASYETGRGVRKWRFPFLINEINQESNGQLIS